MTTSATYTVVGMTCGGCVRKVRSAISELEGVTDVDVRFTGGQVTVTGEAATDRAAVEAAVADAGYEVAP